MITYIDLSICFSYICSTYKFFLFLYQLLSKQTIEAINTLLSYAKQTKEKDTLK